MSQILLEIPEDSLLVFLSRLADYGVDTFCLTEVDLEREACLA